MHEWWLDKMWGYQRRNIMSREGLTQPLTLNPKLLMRLRVYGAQGFCSGGLGAIAASAITSLAELSVLSKYAYQIIDEVKRHLAFPCVERDHFSHDCVQV